MSVSGEQQPGAQPSAVDRWVAAFRLQYGREPSLAEYQAAVARGEVPAPGQDQNVQQLARQLTHEVSQKFTEQIGAPLGQKVRQISATSSQFASALQWAPLILIGASVVGIFSLFLPVVSYGGKSANFFSKQANGEGGFLLFGFLLCIAGGALVRLYRRRWSVITVGVVSLLVTIVLMFDSFGNMATFSKDNIPVGAGLVMLGIVSVVSAAAAVLILLNLFQLPKQPRRSAASQWQQPWNPTAPQAPMPQQNGAPVAFIAQDAPAPSAQTAPQPPAVPQGPNATQPPAAAPLPRSRRHDRMTPDCLRPMSVGMVNPWAHG